MAGRTSRHQGLPRAPIHFRAQLSPTPCTADAPVRRFALHHRPVFNGGSTVHVCKLTLARSSSPSCRQRQSHPQDRTLKGMWRQTGRLDAIRPPLRRTSTCRKHPSQPGPWAAVGEMEMILLVRPQQHVKSKKMCLPARCISKSPRGFSDCSLSPPLLPLVPTAAQTGPVKLGGNRPGGCRQRRATAVAAGQ